MGSTFLYVKTFIPKLSQARCASVRYPGSSTFCVEGAGCGRTEKLPSGSWHRAAMPERVQTKQKVECDFPFMDDGSITLLAALIILVAFSAFFSASETAFSSLNQIRLKSRAEDGDSAAARVLAMSEKYDKLLSTILIGNNIVNIAAASIGTVLFTRLLDPERGATVSTFVLTIVVLIFGEVTPKSLAKEMPETVATAVSPF